MGDKAYYVPHTLKSLGDMSPRPHVLHGIDASDYLCICVLAFIISITNVMNIIANLLQPTILEIDQVK